MENLFFFRACIDQNDHIQIALEPSDSEVFSVALSRARFHPFLYNIMDISPENSFFGTCYMGIRGKYFYRCLLELRRHAMQLSGELCSKTEAENLFLPYDETNLHLLATHDCCMGVLLPYAGNYRFSAATLGGHSAHLLHYALRRKAVQFGKDFPSICLRRGSSVCWYDTVLFRHHLFHAKIILVPIKSENTSKILAFYRPVDREEILNSVSQTSIKNTQAHFSLTARECQALHMAIQGRTNRYISAQMGIGENMVKTTLSSVYEKCCVSSRIELIRSFSLSKSFYN